MAYTSNASMLHCDLCDVSVSSEGVMISHLNGKKHQNLFKYKQSQELLAARSIFVRGFPFGTTDDQLKEKFSRFGSILKIVTSREQGVYALIEYSEIESAKKALDFSGDIFIGGRCLTVKPRLMKSMGNIKNRNKWAENIKSSELVTQVGCKEMSKVVENTMVSRDPRENDFRKESLKSCTSIEEQIKALVNHLELDAEDQAQRNEISNEIQQLFDKHLPGCTVHLFGSSANMLGVRGCDIDLTVVSADNGAPPSVSVKDVARVLRQAGVQSYSDVIAIAAARCPVVKFTHVPTQIHCDITIDNRLGLRNTELIRYYVSRSSTVRHLVYVIRYWARQCGVTGSAGGHLTNYALTLSVLFYLQKTEPPVVQSLNELSRHIEERCFIDGWDCTFRSDASINLPTDLPTLSDLLRGYFQFMAAFDFNTHVMCTRSGQAVQLAAFSETVSNNPKLAKFKISSMCIQDPFVLDHNIASNVNDKQSMLVKHHYLSAASLCSQPQFTTWTSNSSLPGGLLHLLTTTSVDSEPVIASFSLRRSLNDSSSESCRNWCRDVAEVVRASLSEILSVSLNVRDEPSSTLVAHACGRSHSDVSSADQGCAISSPSNFSRGSLSVHSELVPRKRMHSGDEASAELKRLRGDHCDEHQVNSFTTPTKSNCSPSGDSHETVESVACNGATMVKLTADDTVSTLTTCDVQEPNSAALGFRAPNGSESLSVGENLLCADCSASLRLWTGRKKVRHQFKNLTGDYLREIEVSKALKTNLVPSATPVLAFEILVTIADADTVVIALSPTPETVSEFPCFVMFFKYLLTLLVEKGVTATSAVVGSKNT